MRVLLVQVPSRRSSVDLPLGLCAVATAAEASGHTTTIVDLGLPAFLQGRPDGAALIHAVEEVRPDVVGFGGIATSYGRAATLSRRLKAEHPHITQVAGGALASVGSYLLASTDVDVVFHGEADRSFPAMLDALHAGNELDGIRGLAFTRNGGIFATGAATQVQCLDDLPGNPYAATDLAPYVRNAQELAPAYETAATMYPMAYDNLLARIGPNPRCLDVVSKRGCTHACFFCYRHMRGVRAFSVSRILSELHWLTHKYDLGGFCFNDELFNHDRAWVMDFCARFHCEFPHSFYRVGGARGDTMDAELLTALRESGCIEISYGQESGSEVMLREYRKGVTAQQNREVTRRTLGSGMLTTVQLVLGGPSESPATINETVKWLHETGVYNVSPNYLIALPETPIWRVVEQRGMVDDVRTYLDAVAEKGGTVPLLNFTSLPRSTVETWEPLIRFSLRADYCRARRRWLQLLYWHLRLAWLRMPLPVRGTISRVLRFFRGAKVATVC